MDSKTVRMEKDALGEMAVPASAYWGINVARAMENFPISRRRVHPRMITAYCRIKLAAARVNAEAGRLPAEKAGAIEAAAREVQAEQLRDQFVVDFFQAGAGTSTNMNVNEVLCNRALELLGHARGDYATLHPNDHVNLGQSTNDSYPTAMRLAGVDALDAFYPEAAALAKSFRKLARRFRRVLKSGRTHLQDAVPVTLGGEMGGYAGSIEAGLRHVRRTAADLFELGIGGSAAGTGMNTHPAFARRIAQELARETGRPFRPGRDLMHLMQSQGAIGRVSSALKDFAVELGRIANDLRLLSSGPTTGLGEIVLPPVQAGSSIMPGKVNPSIPEMVNMVCFQVMGNDATVSQAVGAGQLELNVMMPVMAENLLESVEILTSACHRLRTHCVAGITAVPDRCRIYAYRSMGLATALLPAIGYARASQVAKQALAQGKTIPELVAAQGLLTEAELRRVLDPLRMTRPDAGLARPKE